MLWLLNEIKSTFPFTQGQIICFHGFTSRHSFVIEQRQPQIAERQCIILKCQNNFSSHGVSRKKIVKESRKNCGQLYTNVCKATIFQRRNLKEL